MTRRCFARCVFIWVCQLMHEREVDCLFHSLMRERECVLIYCVVLVFTSFYGKRRPAPVDVREWCVCACVCVCMCVHGACVLGVHVSLGMWFALVSACVAESLQNVLHVLAVSMHMFSICVIVTAHIATEREMNIIHCFLQSMFFRES